MLLMTVIILRLIASMEKMAIEPNELYVTQKMFTNATCEPCMKLPVTLLSSNTR